jgi:hypothetical protein
MLLWAFAAGCGSEGVEPSRVQTQAPASRAERARSVEPATVVAPSCVGHLRRDVELARDVEPIFMSACSGEFCHRLTTASRAYSFLVNQASTECDDSRPLVTPGDPDRSYVVDKILDRNLCAGHPMPRGMANRLTADEVETIVAWICEGAPR